MNEAEYAMLCQQWVDAYVRVAVLRMQLDQAREINRQLGDELERTRSCLPVRKRGDE